MKFKDIIGQKQVIDSLINSFHNDTISHSYIFEGPAGIGKKTIAQAFAQMLVCKNTSEAPCGNCNECKLFDSGNHPDVKLVVPEKSISVNTIRELVKDISVKPYYNGKKVYIIANAQEMTDEAQNCLLKTLEEPPDYGVIILTVTNSNLLLPTIISRCIIKKFTRNKREEMREYLTRNYPQSIERADLFISLSDGLIGKLTEILNSNEFLDLRKQTFSIFQKLIQAAALDAFETSELFNEQKDNIDLLLNIMLLLFRDLLIIKNIDETELIVNSDYKDILINISRNVSSEFINKSIDVIIEAKKKIDIYANFSATIDVMLLKIIKCRRQ